MTETSIVSSSRASFNASSETTPSDPTGRNVTLNPLSSRYRNGSFTEECSIPDTITWFPFLLFAIAAPIIAMLLDSVPPEVNTISFS